MVPAARKSPAWPKRAAQPHGGTSDARPGLSEPITFESYSDKTEASPGKEPTKFHVVNAERKTKRWPGRKPASAAVKHEWGHPERPEHRPRGPSPGGGHRPDVAPCPRGRPYSLCLQKFMISSRNPLPPPPKTEQLWAETCATTARGRRCGPKPAGLPLAGTGSAAGRGLTPPRGVPERPGWGKKYRGQGFLNGKQPSFLFTVVQNVTRRCCVEPSAVPGLKRNAFKRRGGRKNGDGDPKERPPLARRHRSLRFQNAPGRRGDRRERKRDGATTLRPAQGTAEGLRGRLALLPAQSNGFSNRESKTF